MSALLDEVLAAHGGLERWRAVTAITAHATFGGLLRARFRRVSPRGPGGRSLRHPTLVALDIDRIEIEAACAASTASHQAAGVARRRH